MGREDGLTGTFFCVTTAMLSLPLTAMLVFPAAFTALKAYSAGNMQLSLRFCTTVMSHMTGHAGISTRLWNDRYLSLLYLQDARRTASIQWVGIDALMMGPEHTDLEETTLRAEDRDMPIIPAAAASGHSACSINSACKSLLHLHGSVDRPCDKSGGCSLRWKRPALGRPQDRVLSHEYRLSASASIV